MKTIQKMIFALAALLALVACDTEEELISNGYVVFNGVKVIFQADNTINYSFTLDNDSIEQNESVLFSPDKTTGILRVFRNDETMPELETEVAINGPQVELIQVHGRPVAFYDDESYTTFTLNVFYLSGQEDLYTAYFGGQELSRGMNLNYISRDDLTGILEIYADGEEAPVFAQEDITLEPEGMVNILQLSDTEFLYLEGGGDEEAPESDDFTKVRVFYTPDDLLTEDSYTMKVYAMTSYSWDVEAAILIGTIEIRSGELSPYVLVDMRTFRDYGGYGEPTMLTYDLITESGEMVADHLSYMIYAELTTQGWGEGNPDLYYKSRYMFQTLRISDNYGYPVGVFAFGDEWETSAAE